MKKIIAFVFLITLISCKDNDAPDSCGVADPVNELVWLKAKVDELKNSELSQKYFYLVQAEYNGETVFYVNNCCPMCMTVIIYYDCAGNQVEADASKVTNGKTIWISDKNECLF